MNSNIYLTVIEVSFFIMGIFMSFAYMSDAEKLHWKKLRISVMLITMFIILFNIISDKTIFAAIISLLSFIGYYTAVSYKPKENDDRRNNKPLG